MPDLAVVIAGSMPLAVLENRLFYDFSICVKFIQFYLVRTQIVRPTGQLKGI